MIKISKWTFVGFALTLFVSLYPTQAMSIERKDDPHKQAVSSFASFPTEATLHILSNLDKKERDVASLVCKMWCDGIDSETKGLRLTTADNVIVNLSRFPNLTSLEMACTQMTDEDLIPLQKLIGLNLIGNRGITDRAISQLTNLTELNLGCMSYGDNKSITDAALIQLTNLRALGLRLNSTITSRALELLTNLKSLDLSANKKITNRTLVLLTNIENLTLSYNVKIHNATLFLLTNLTSLNLSNNNVITDMAVTQLTNLTELNLRGNTIITEPDVDTLKIYGKLRIFR